MNKSLANDFILVFCSIYINTTHNTKHKMTDNFDITIKGLSGNSHVITINSDDTINSKITEIYSKFSFGDDTNIKLIFSGKVIFSTETPNESTTFKSCGIKQGDFLVVMNKKQTAKRELPPAPPNTPATSTTSTAGLPPNTQSRPSQSTPQISLQTTENYWATPVQSQDTTPSYTFEQIYAILPIFTMLVFKLAIYQPEFIIGLMSCANDPNKFVTLLTHEITNPLNVQLLRNTLQNSHQMIPVIRQNRGNVIYATKYDSQTGEIVAQLIARVPQTETVATNNNQQTPSSNLSNTFNQQTTSIDDNVSDNSDYENYDTNNLSNEQMMATNLDNLSDEEINQMMTSMISNPAMLQHLLATIGSTNGSSDLNSAYTAPSAPTPEDLEQINVIMEITGCTQNIASNAYFSSSKDVNLAINIIMGNFAN